MKYNINLDNPYVEKVKLDPATNQVYIKCSSAEEDHEDEHAMHHGERPHADFLRAFQDLQEDVLCLCEIPYEDFEPDHRERELERVTVTGVSFTWKNDVMGAVITAQRTLQDALAPLNLNTPHKTREYYGETGDPRQLLPARTARKLDHLIEEALEYLNGKRAPDPQGNLFDESASMFDEPPQPTEMVENS